MAQRIITRNGTTTQWSTTNPVLASGEFGLENNTGRFKIGDGITSWNLLPYRDIAGSIQTKPYRSFGDGSDGDVSITGPVTLVRDMFYNNLTISGAGSINTNNYKIFIKGILNLSLAEVNAINNNGENGGNASGSTAGVVATIPAAGSFGNSNGQGTNGATGVVGAGVTTSQPTGGTGNGGISNSAGNGSAGLNAGASGGSGNTPAVNDINTYVTNFYRGVTLLGGGVGGRGGASGGGDGVNSGGGGGAGGNGGRAVGIYANIIITSSLTKAGAISAIGGNGGNGGTALAGTCGGGGGGAGGGGGYVYLAYNEKHGPIINNLINASGGIGGNGGNGTGLLNGNPVGGAGGGQGGFGGRIYVYQVPTSTGISVFPATNAIHVPAVLSVVTTSLTEIGRAGGISGPLFLSF